MRAWEGGGGHDASYDRHIFQIGKISSKYQNAIFNRPVNLGEGGMATSQGVVRGGYMSHMGYIAGVFGYIGVK